MISYNDFVLRVFNTYLSNSNIRIGQCIMNVLQEVNAPLYRVVREETEYDCFYKDQLVASTLQFLYEHWDY